jgi:hypothetical protein
MSDQTQSNVHQLGAFDAQAMLAEVRALRQRVVDAWRERAVLLTREEQKELRDEINDTCALLTELTKS